MSVQTFFLMALLFRMLSGKGAANCAPATAA